MQPPADAAWPRPLGTCSPRTTGRGSRLRLRPGLELAGAGVCGVSRCPPHTFQINEKHPRHLSTATGMAKAVASAGGSGATTAAGPAGAPPAVRQHKVAPGVGPRPGPARRPLLRRKPSQTARGVATTAAHALEGGARDTPLPQPTNLHRGARRTAGHGRLSSPYTDPRLSCTRGRNGAGATDADRAGSGRGQHATQAARLPGPLSDVSGKAAGWWWGPTRWAPARRWETQMEPSPGVAAIGGGTQHGKAQAGSRGPQGIWWRDRRRGASSGGDGPGDAPLHSVPWSRRQSPPAAQTAVPPRGVVSVPVAGPRGPACCSAPLRGGDGLARSRLRSTAGPGTSSAGDRRAPGEGAQAAVPLARL